MGVPLHVICHFSRVAFTGLSLISVSLITVCLGVPPWVYAAWDSLCSLDLAGCFISHVNEVFSYYLLKYFVSSFSLSPLL